MFGSKKKNPASFGSGKGVRTVPIKKHPDKQGGHYHIIVDTFDNKHASVGMTRQSTKGRSKSNSTNFKLERDPLGRGNTSYIRRQGTVDDVKNYHGRMQGKLSDKDYWKVKSIGEKARLKYRDKKKK